MEVEDGVTAVAGEIGGGDCRGGGRREEN